MEEITKLMSGMKDPGAVVLNCVLQRGGVSSMEDVCGYLSMAAAAGLRNTSFITMFDCNEFTRQNRVSPAQFPVMSGEDEAKEALQRIGRKYGMRFALWNHLHDYDHCSCVTGSCATAQGETGFYFRCPGTAQSAAYCRQLVYTADDRLRDGFGGQLLK